MLKWSSKIIVWVMLAAFAGVLAWIVAQRLGSGDIYPEYSSLRADPLGTKAFYESIDRLPGRNVNRHLHPLTRLRGSRDVTVLVLGTPSLAAVDAGFFEHLERIARTGGRVVLAINATDSHDAMREEDRINTPELPIKKDDETEKEKEENPVSKRFRGELALIDPLRREQKQIIAELVPENGGLKLPATLRWYGRYCSKNCRTNGRSFMKRKENPSWWNRKSGLERWSFARTHFRSATKRWQKTDLPSFFCGLPGTRGQLRSTNRTLACNKGIASCFCCVISDCRGCFSDSSF